MDARHKILLMIFVILALVGCSQEASELTPTIESIVVRKAETIVPLTQITSGTPISTLTPTLITTPIPTHAPTLAPTPTQAVSLFQITFISERSSKSGIYAVDIYCLEFDAACLGKPVLLFNRDEYIFEHDWSPDGNRVALIIDLRGRLLLADWDGENATQITKTCGSAGWPKWSPDGKKIAFIYNPGRPGCESLDPSQINLYDVETGQITRILENVVDPSRVYWLEENILAYIAQVSPTDQTQTISVVNLDNGETKQVLENSGTFRYLFGLDFSPDLDKLLFAGETSQEGGKSRDIFLLDLSTGITLNLTKGSGDNFDPAWTPYENVIYFPSDREGNNEIYLLDYHKETLFNITRNASPDWFPALRLSNTP